MTKQQRQTIHAALRQYQASATTNAISPGIREIATNNGKDAALTEMQIDEMCRKLCDPESAYYVILAYPDLSEEDIVNSFYSADVRATSPQEATQKAKRQAATANGMPQEDADKFISIDVVQCML